MFLYHVTLDLRHRGYFKPRLPEAIELYDEDDETPRICFAPSIEQCLTSVPFGGYNLKENLLENNRVLKVFRIEITEQMITQGLVIPPDVLYRTGKVNDAFWTKEHWIMQDLYVTEKDVCYIEVLDYNVITLNKKGVIVEKIEDYIDVKDCIVDLKTRILA